MSVSINPVELFESITGKKPESITEEAHAEAFLKLMKQMQASKHYDTQRLNDKAQAAELEAKKAKTARRVNELRSLIAKLRERLHLSGHDPAVASQLAMAETELFWLLFSL